MPQRNWEQERERLRAVYLAMTDAEFQEVANAADSLTEVARATPRAEMLRRGMEDRSSGITYRYSHPRREAGVELRRHTWDDPVEGFFAADTMGGWMFVIEFAFCGVCRKEGGAGAE